MSAPSRPPPPRTEGRATGGIPMPKEPELEHPTAGNARSAANTWRILFLDSAEHALQLKGACKDVGYVVVSANTIDEAWAFLNGKDHADVIVCAAHLPEESVFEFLKSVRDSATHRNAMFLILSLEATVTAARLDRSTARTGRALGADAYVVMPVFDAAELVVQIRLLQPKEPMLQQDERRRSLTP